MTSEPVLQVPHLKRTPKAPMIFTALAALILSFGLLFGVQYVGQSQDLQQQAATGQTIQLRMNGQTVGNNVFHVDLYVNSQGHNLVGTQVSGKITGMSASDVSIDLNNSLNLQSVGSKVTQSGSDAQFDFTQFAPLDSSKRVNTNGQEVKFATLTVRRNQGTTFTVSFDSSKTSIPVAGNSQISLDIAPARTFTIAQYNGPANTPTPTPGTNVGDQGIHRSCNEYCADKNECASGLSCYFNRCRNPQNLNSESCSAAPTPKPSPTIVYVPAATPQPASPRPTVSPSPVASPSPTPSASPTATGSGTLYDENSLRVSPSPTIKKASPSPTVVQTAQTTGNNRLLTAGLILLVALGIVIPVGIYLYRRVR